MRALDRREPDGGDDPAELTSAGTVSRATISYSGSQTTQPGQRDGPGERAVMATDKKKNPDKNSADSKAPDKKNNDKKILAFVERCENPAELESLIKNATKLGNAPVAEAAFRKRISLVPAERPGSVEHDFWQMVQAFEFTLSEERGKNTRLSRTRQKVAKAGVVQTLRDWAVGSQETAGFRMLLERGMPEFTGEAITLRHPEHFEPPVLEAAQQRLTAAGVDLTSLR
jgi:hypothetical protein